MSVYWLFINHSKWLEVCGKRINNTLLGVNAALRRGFDGRVVAAFVATRGEE
jgi:hypothetical protein